MLRITGGSFRSRLLKTPFSEATKPTMDKVRLGVFSALNDRVINADVLDLFAGSGSYGFEALSRGAKSATFVDNGFEAIKCIKENAQVLDINANIFNLTVLAFLNECHEKYDLIFIDPPYSYEAYQETIDLILSRNLLTEFGIIIIEGEKELTLKEDLFQKVKMYKYGIAKIYILRK